MVAKYPRFIITVNAQQAAMAWTHDEAWFQTLALWQRGCVVRCEPTGLSVAEAEADRPQGEPGEVGSGTQSP